MGNNTSRKGQRHTQQRQQSNFKLSREQLIFRLETLREELEENPNLSQERKVRIHNDITNYSQQLDKF